MPRKVDLNRMARPELLRAAKETFPEVDGRVWWTQKLDTIRETIHQHDLSIAFPDGVPSKEDLATRGRPKSQEPKVIYQSLSGDTVDVLERLIIRLGRQALTKALLDTDDERMVARLHEDGR